MKFKNIQRPDQFILNSPYDPLPIDDIGTTSAVDFILAKVSQNISNGRTNWITNAATGESITLPDLERLSRRVASALTKRGMGKGSVGLYMTTNVTKFYLMVFGIWRTGGITHSSYPEDTADVLLMRLQETKTAWVFCDNNCVPEVSKAIALLDWPVEIFVFDDPPQGTTPFDQLLLDDGTACPPKSPSADLDDPVLILCTSGTTGLSKSCVHTNRSFLRFNFGFSCTTDTSRPAMKLVRTAHFSGLCFPIRDACRGMWVLMMNPITKENIFECVQKYKPVLVCGFPTFIRLLIEDPSASGYDLSSLETICTGSVTIPEEFYTTMLRMPNLQRVINGYGLTEVGNVTTTSDLHQVTNGQTIQPSPPLSVGRLYPDSFLKVVHLETGINLGPNECGELYVKTPNMSSGYWNRPVETAQAFINGWFRTGDLGYYDDNGYVFLTDRIKDTFKYYNNHISPNELEVEILKHPGVAEVCVFGIVDPEGGDRVPRAVVVPKSGVKVLSSQIEEFVKGRLASYKHLRGGVFIVDTLPKGKSGKLERSVVAKMVA